MEPSLKVTMSRRSGRLGSGTSKKKAGDRAVPKEALYEETSGWFR